MCDLPSDDLVLIISLGLICCFCCYSIHFVVFRDAPVNSEIYCIRRSLRTKGVSQLGFLVLVSFPAVVIVIGAVFLVAVLLDNLGVVCVLFLDVAAVYSFFGCTTRQIRAYLQQRDHRLPGNTDELRKDVQHLTTSVQELRTQVAQLHEHRAEIDCRLREELNRFDLTVNTMHKSLGELWETHIATEKKSAQHADATDGELRALRCSHIALEEGIDARCTHIVERVVKSFVKEMDTESQQKQGQLQMDVSRSWEQLVELELEEELRNVARQCELSDEQHSEVQALSRSLRCVARDLQEEVQRLDGESKELSQLQSDMRTEVAADREELSQVRRGLKDQEKLLQKVFTTFDVRAEVKSHETKLQEIRRGLEENEKLLLRLFANETASERKATSDI
mmetsp:Transcript_58/g.168  ORF Transcript_58/g.168 Transcript_58/m.168 type:complete len:394 (-) Transcript_58:248-1429(-)